MKTYVFNESNGNASLTISARNFEEAFTYLIRLVKDTDDWRVEDEGGEEEN